MASILVVDDDAQILSLLSAALSDAGHRTFTTMTATEGLVRFSEGDPDLVLLDLRLPDGDGMELLKTMSERKPDTVVIIVSAVSASSKSGEALRSGAYDYIEKPLEMNRVLIAVRNALETQSLKRKLEALGRGEPVVDPEGRDSD